MKNVWNSWLEPLDDESGPLLVPISQICGSSKFRFIFWWPKRNPCRQTTVTFRVFVAKILQRQVLLPWTTPRKFEFSCNWGLTWSITSHPELCQLSAINHHHLESVYVWFLKRHGTMTRSLKKLPRNLFLDLFGLFGDILAAIIIQNIFLHNNYYITNYYSNNIIFTK